jgi:hypothetical protein
MPETAQTYANMLKIQAAQRQVGRVNKSKSPLPVIVAPKTAPRNINLSNFTPAQHAHLAAVAASMRAREPTELEKSYAALKKAENTGKKRSRRRSTRRRHRTRSRK